MLQAMKFTGAMKTNSRSSRASLQNQTYWKYERNKEQLRLARGQKLCMGRNKVSSTYRLPPDPQTRIDRERRAESSLASGSLRSVIQNQTVEPFVPEDISSSSCEQLGLLKSIPRQVPHETASSLTHHLRRSDSGVRQHCVPPAAWPSTS